jgi:peptidoglycan/LPS O-acetylase OafA/YrhL
LHPAARFEWLEDALFLTSPAPAYNASFWTLGIEAQWYVLFPAILSLFVRSKPAFVAVMAAASLAYAWHSELVAVGALPCFMLGIVAAQIFVSRKAASPLFAMLALASLALAILTDPSDLHGHPLWHLAAFFAVVAGVGIGWMRDVLAWRPLAGIGVASYSIYLVHQPIILWLMRYDIPWPVCAALGVAAGLLFWLVVEKPALGWQALAKERRRTAPAVAT